MPRVYPDDFNVTADDVLQDIDMAEIAWEGVQALIRGPERYVYLLALREVFDKPRSYMSKSDINSIIAANRKEIIEAGWCPDHGHRLSGFGYCPQCGEVD